MFGFFLIYSCAIGNVRHIFWRDGSCIFWQSDGFTDFCNERICRIQESCWLSFTVSFSPFFRIIHWLISLFLTAMVFVSSRLHWSLHGLCSVLHRVISFADFAFCVTMMIWHWSFISGVRRPSQILSSFFSCATATPVRNVQLFTASSIHHWKSLFFKIVSGILSKVWEKVSDFWDRVTGFPYIHELSKLQNMQNRNNRSI